MQVDTLDSQDFLQCFMAGRDQWPVLITVGSARYCYKFKNALSILDIHPTTHPDAILHRSDFKIFFKLLLGEFLLRVPADAKYFKFIPNED